jgi:hypothetical protein
MAWRHHWLNAFQMIDTIRLLQPGNCPNIPCCCAQSHIPCCCAQSYRVQIGHEFSGNLIIKIQNQCVTWPWRGSINWFPCFVAMTSSLVLASRFLASPGMRSDLSQTQVPGLVVVIASLKPKSIFLQLQVYLQQGFGSARLLVSNGLVLV